MGNIAVFLYWHLVMVSHWIWSHQLSSFLILNAMLKWTGKLWSILILADRIQHSEAVCVYYTASPCSCRSLGELISDVTTRCAVFLSAPFVNRFITLDSGAPEDRFSSWSQAIGYNTDLKWCQRRCPATFSPNSTTSILYISLTDASLEQERFTEGASKMKASQKWK